MSTDPSTPALADQLAMYTREELTRLADSLAVLDARRGKAQNQADFIAYLSREHSPATLAALAVAAVRRIREREQEARS